MRSFNSCSLDEASKPLVNEKLWHLFVEISCKSDSEVLNNQTKAQFTGEAFDEVVCTEMVFESNNDISKPTSSMSIQQLNTNKFVLFIDRHGNIHFNPFSFLIQILLS